jgi:hypothetical protein
MNLSKSGVSWTFGPRGMHYTVGPRGTRSTVGLPGTGISYTTYSHAHARGASRQRATRTVAAPAAYVPAARRPPMLPKTKVTLGVVLGIVGLLLIIPVLPLGLLVLVAGLAYGLVGWQQRSQPLWQVRAVLRQADAHPERRDELLESALAIDTENPEALAAMADRRLQEQRWQDAGELYDRYLVHAPDDILAVGHAGNAWTNAGKLDRAIPLLIRARDDLRLDEDSRAGMTAMLGMAYLKSGQPDQAAVVVGSQPLNRHNLSHGLEQCLFIRAMAHYGAGQKSKGIADLDRLARLNLNFEHLEETRQEMLTGTFTLPTSSA